MKICAYSMCVRIECVYSIWVHIVCVCIVHVCTQHSTCIMQSRSQNIYAGLKTSSTRIYLKINICFAHQQQFNIVFLMYNCTLDKTDVHKTSYDKCTQKTNKIIWNVTKLKKYWKKSHWSINICYIPMWHITMLSHFMKLPTRNCQNAIVLLSTAKPQSFTLS